MDQLIDAIRAAMAPDATVEAKGIGVQACRTIIAALDTEPGKPLVMPGTSASAPAARPTLDQVLDMMVAKLTLIAAERDKNPAPALPPPNGLRVPVMRAAPPRVVPRSATKPVTATRPSPTRKA